MGPRWRCSPTPSIAISTGKSFEAALAVLLAGGRRVHLPVPASGTRPLCCGRTFLAVGAVDEAKMECARLLEALSPFVARGVPILGLEPSCLYSLRDELLALMPSDATRALSARARRRS